MQNAAESERSRYPHISQAHLSTAAEIAFLVADRPGSFFYELLVQFDGRLCETSGSRMLSRMPEDQIMRAALRILCGEDDVHVWIDGQPGLARLTFAPVRLDGAWISPMTPAAVRNLGCQIERIECDETTGAPIEPPVVWGIAGSAIQMARAAYELGHARYLTGNDPPPAPVSLLALRAALDLVDPLWFRRSHEPARDLPRREARRGDEAHRAMRTRIASHHG